ncbi:MAG: hypothetical protein L0154_17015 [Chloroflexi bacterium]|nr:hypothetical protein [Chloroflexota bacterium]
MFNHNLKQQITKIVMAVIIVVVSLNYWAFSAQATGPIGAELNVNDLITLSAQGEGQVAVNAVHGAARGLGNWGPAPGDSVVYDKFMMRHIRGAVIDFDEVPAQCFEKSAMVDTATCEARFRELEAQVRFGPSFFTTPTEDGKLIRVADDVLATFIEEVGHSWQEYAFETQGAMNGPRQRQTTLTEAEYWSKGREYQIKRYILNLDGEYLDLSETQREIMLAQICQGDGYANPLGAEVPNFGPPPNWVRADAWVNTTPTLNDHMEFCTSQLG